MVKALLFGMLFAGVAYGQQQPTPESADKRIKATRHTDAYEKHPERGEHIGIKVTPPGKRGKPGFVLVEVYNFSKSYMTLLSFDITLLGSWGDGVSAHIEAEDIAPNWSGLRWVKVPKGGEVPEIQKVRIERLELFDKSGKRLNLKYFTDIIKS